MLMGSSLVVVHDLDVPCGAPLEAYRDLLVGQPDAGMASHAFEIRVGFQAGRMDAMGGELLVAVLGVAGDADGADDLPVGAADLQAAALGKNLLAACAHEIAHEDRP